MITKEDWSVEVRPGEIHKFRLDQTAALHITQVALVKKGGEGVVEDFTVYCDSLSNIGGDTIRMVLATLSEGAPEAVMNFLLLPRSTIELSHGWKDGSVIISGLMDINDGLGYYESGASQDRNPTTKEVEWVDPDKCIPCFEQGTSDWSVVVGPNESLKITVRKGEFIRITQVSLVKNGGQGEGVVEEFNVYCKRITYDQKVLLGTLSSEEPQTAVPPMGLVPAEIAEFFHRWKDGSVRIDGEIYKQTAQSLMFDELSSEVVESSGEATSSKKRKLSSSG